MTAFVALSLVHRVARRCRGEERDVVAVRLGDEMIAGRRTKLERRARVQFEIDLIGDDRSGANVPRGDGAIERVPTHDVGRGDERGVGKKFDVLNLTQRADVRRRGARRRIDANVPGFHCRIVASGDEEIGRVGIEFDGRHVGGMLVRRYDATRFDVPQFCRLVVTAADDFLARRVPLGFAHGLAVVAEEAMTGGGVRAMGIPYSHGAVHGRGE